MLKGVALLEKNGIESSCLRCSESKDWDHVANFRRAEGKRDEYLTKLIIKSAKADNASKDLTRTSKAAIHISEFLKK